MRLLVLSLATVVALAVPALAAAKELAQAQLCGPNACTTIDDESTLREIPTGGDSIAPPPPTAPFYTVRFTVDAEGETHRFLLYYVPQGDVLAAAEEGDTVVWRPIYGSAIGLMERLVRNIEPFPAPRLSGVSVGGRRVAGDPASYLSLLEVEPAGPLTELADDWVAIDFRSRTPSPWTDGPRELMYSPSTNMLERGGAQFPLAADVAADVEAARPIAADGTRWLPWLVLGALVLALVVLAALARVRWILLPQRPEPA